MAKRAYKQLQEERRAIESSLHMEKVSLQERILCLEQKENQLDVRATSTTPSIQSSANPGMKELRAPCGVLNRRGWAVSTSSQDLGWTPKHSHPQCLPPRLDQEGQRRRFEGRPAVD
jgi:hypothetical protein